MFGFLKEQEKKPISFAKVEMQKAERKPPLAETFKQRLIRLGGLLRCSKKLY